MSSELASLESTRTAVSADLPVPSATAIPPPTSLLAAGTPADVVERACGIARQPADVVNQRKLYASVRGRKFVLLEGWTTCGAMCGVVPREVSVTEADDGSFTATVELIRIADQAVIGRASTMCGADEELWKDRPRHMRMSMAVTRAASKAFRLSFAWVIRLAGYEPTPAEEMSSERDRDHMDAVSDAEIVSPAPVTTTTAVAANAIEIDTSTVVGSDDPTTDAQQQEIRDLAKRLEMTSQQARSVVVEASAFRVERLSKLTIREADKAMQILKLHELEKNSPF